MSATEVLTPTAQYRLREFHSFGALDARFVYLVPSGAIFALNKIGGDTLLNFPMLRSSVEYAKRKCSEAGKQVEFSLTTNATLLTEHVVDFLAEHKVGITVSIDGDRQLNDNMRVFSDGRGSYDVILPRIKMLLERHK